MDGHESHKTPEMRRLAIEHNIEFYFLPPHTTHRLQPLDVGIFGPLQRKWQERCDEIIGETNGEVPRSEFVKEYMDVRNGVFTKELIQSAWKKAGMWPRNPHKFTEKDFAPSKLMSYTACLPPGYPELPEVPDMLMFTQGSGDEAGEGDEVGGDGNGSTDEVMDEMMDEVTSDDDEIGDGDGDGGGEVDESNDECDKADEDGGEGEGGETDDEMNGVGLDDRGDNEVASEGETNAGDGGEAVEASEGTIAGGTDTLRNNHCLSRYDEELTIWNNRCSRSPTVLICVGPPLFL